MPETLLTVLWFIHHEIKRFLESYGVQSRHLSYFHVYLMYLTPEVTLFPLIPIYLEFLNEEK